MSVDIIARGMAAGKADLVGGKVPAEQLPSYVDEVIEVESYADLPEPGDKSKIYLTLDNHKTYRWTGTVYIEPKGDGDRVEKSNINGNIKVDDNELIVYTLPQSYKEYLDEMIYEKPIINQFELLDQNGSFVQNNYELGSSVIISKIKHYEENIKNFDGILTLGSNEIEPTDISTTVSLSKKISLNETSDLILSGVDIQGNTVDKKINIAFDRYAYIALNSSNEIPTSGIKQKTLIEFEKEGTDVDYTIGDYLYLYIDTPDKIVETCVFGQWAEVQFEALNQVEFIQENNVKHKYYVYRVGPFIASGTAKYRV